VRIVDHGISNSYFGEDMRTPHKHAELIKMWADGHEIQRYSRCNECWVDDPCPTWHVDSKYRRKPKPDAVRYIAVNLIKATFMTDHRTGTDNLKLTFDGDTGKLKAAEVLV
jgi:hypothetical protein